MIYKLLPVLGVDNDISEAVVFYESVQENLGSRFLDDWESTVNYITSNPFGCNVKRKSFRQANLKSFPYLIIYEVAANSIIIYGVIHNKKHPKKRYVRKNKS